MTYKQTSAAVLWSVIATGAMVVFAFTAMGADMALDQRSGSRLATIARGGMLYDKWYAELKMDPPKSTHPSYATSQGKQKGSGTWRCKECHGWDYLGKDGAYAKGSHFSGIAGIQGSAGGSENAVVASLKGSAHKMGDLMSEQDLRALAVFVVEGQLDPNPYIDRGSKKAKGSVANGERIYMTVCTKCHGADGKKINFGDEKEPEYVGTVANDNPWEVLHKLRMGQPGKEMPALLALPVQLLADTLAYSQTLPEK